MIWCMCPSCVYFYFLMCVQEKSWICDSFRWKQSICTCDIGCRLCPFFTVTVVPWPHMFASVSYRSCFRGYCAMLECVCAGLDSNQAQSTLGATGHEMSKRGAGRAMCYIYNAWKWLLIPLRWLQACFTYRLCGVLIIHALFICVPHS